MLLEHSPSDQTDAIILDACSAGMFSWDLQFLSEVKTLLQEKSRLTAERQLVSKIADLNRELRLSFPEMKEFRDREKPPKLNRYEAIFDALDLPDIPCEQDEIDVRPGGALLYFSAFCNTSKVNATAMFYEGRWVDHWAWIRPYDRTSTREALQGLLGICGIDLHELRKDALIARKVLMSANDDLRPSLWIDVDPPALDWSLAPSLGLDLSMLEEALYHPSRWIGWIAANLLDQLLPQPDLRRAVRRLLDGENESALWIVSGFASIFTEDEFVALIVARLSGNLVPGCEYLFKRLQKFPLSWNADLYQVLLNGFSHGLPIAQEAAGLAVNVSRPGLVELECILENAIDFWKEDDKTHSGNESLLIGNLINSLERALLKAR